jgi:hypothetical protein
MTNVLATAREHGGGPRTLENENRSTRKKIDQSARQLLARTVVTRGQQSRETGERALKSPDCDNRWVICNSRIGIHT